MNFPRAGLASVVRNSPTGTYTVTRTAARAYTAGRANVPVETTLSVSAHVQPMDRGKVALLLADGKTFVSAVEIWLETLLYQGGEAFEADSISIGGLDYEIQTVENFAGLAGFYRCTAIA